MIETVVNSILEAEDEAKRRIEQAQARASEIVAAAEAEAATYKKKEAQDNKKFFAELLQKADEAAESKARERLAELNAETDKELVKCAKNTDKAVKIIIEAK